MRDNGPNGWCWKTEEHIHNITKYLVSSGLAALGYTYVDVDEGWLKGRNAAGQMYEDTDKFPSGMKVCVAMSVRRCISPVRWRSVPLCLSLPRALWTFHLTSPCPCPSHPELKALGDFIHAQETSPGSGQYMKYGLYSCRGTCQCGTGTYSAPGSHGYEAADVDWMVAAGADLLKIDS